MENLKKYIEIKNSSLLKSSFSFEDLFTIIHDQGERIFCEYLYNYQVNKFSYEQMKEYCFKMATYLSEKNLGGKETYVAIYMENSLNWLASFWALLMLGYKPLLLNCKLPISLNIEILKELNAKAIITSSNIFDDYNEYSIVSLSNGLAPIKDVLNCSLYKPLKWENLIALSTTATTTNYKICIYSGKDIANQVLNTKDIVSENPMIKKGYKGYIKMLCFLPFYHIFGLVASYFWFSIFGRTFVFLTDYSGESILKTVRRHNVTHIFAVPLLWNTIVREIKKSVQSLSEKEQRQFEKGMKLSYKIQNIFPNLGIKFARKIFKRVIDQTLGNSISFMISGGGYVSDETLYILNCVGYPLYNGYGSTEIGISSVELRKKIKHRISGSVGRPFKSTQYCESNGMLLTRGLSMCSYIIPRKANMFVVDKNSWFNTNDNVKVDKSGYYYILGRNDDVVIGANGEKINPDVIEKEMLLTTVNRYCVIEYQKEVSLIVEVLPYTNIIKLNAIYAEVKNAVKLLIEKGYKISKVYYSYDLMINKNAIKVSRKVLKEKIENEDVKLYPFDSLVDNTNFTKVEISKSILEIVGKQFALVLNKNISEEDFGKHFVFELGGTSLDYCTLLVKLKNEFNIEFDFNGQSPSTVEEFSVFISKKINGGKNHE